MYAVCGSAANHGGGYSYRLCPASSALTEECFNAVHLNFSGSSALRWGGADAGRSFSFNATRTSVGTTPPGSMWQKNPVPRNDGHQTGVGFAPVFAGAEGVMGWRNVGKHDTVLETMEILDQLQIPAHLTPGDWVLGWRWDTEESNQVWSSCSDISIVRPAAARLSPRAKTDDDGERENTGNGKACHVKSGAACALPRFAPTWDMRMSTIFMPCNDSGFHDVNEAVQYGIVSYDWSNAKQLWANNGDGKLPMNDEELLTRQAEMVMSADTKPNKTKVWIYVSI